MLDVAYRLIELKATFFTAIARPSVSMNTNSSNILYYSLLNIGNIDSILHENHRHETKI